GHKKGAGGPKVMIAAHMDEIGFLIKHIDDRGFLRLQPVGGFDARQLFSQRVVCHGWKGGSVPGLLVYNTKPTHLLTDEERKQAPKLESFYVDTGKSAEQVKECLRVGDMVTLDRKMERFGDCCSGKAIDNRVGVFVMLEAMRKVGAHQAEIYAVATTQEEIGLRGATTSAFSVEPDIGVA
ncbi:MAG: M42 family peptidase, partial [Planctomycetales bacterium]|nr:M42 family peptidase [Planctomycetales bacterium]